MEDNEYNWIETIVVWVIAGLSIFLGGYTVQCYWEWFVVPVFGVALLSFPLALGLKVLVGYVTHQIKREETKDERSVTEKIFYSIGVGIFYPLVVLLFGWVTHLFI